VLHWRTGIAVDPSSFRQKRLAMLNRKVIEDILEAVFIFRVQKNLKKSPLPEHLLL